jgi:hypothetical protein
MTFQGPGIPLYQILPLLQILTRSKRHDFSWPRYTSLSNLTPSTRHDCLRTQVYLGLKSWPLLYKAWLSQGPGILLYQILPLLQGMTVSGPRYTSVSNLNPFYKAWLFQGPGIPLYQILPFLQGMTVSGPRYTSVSNLTPSTRHDCFRTQVYLCIKSYPFYKS